MVLVAAVFLCGILINDTDVACSRLAFEDCCEPTDETVSFSSV